MTIGHEHGGPPVDQPGFEAPLVGERVAMEGAGLSYWSDTPSMNFDLLRGRIEQSPAS